MTWDEAELRAALREGEGETLSAGHIVALGQARQQRRHDRLRNAAVAVVVTGLLGGGVGALTQLNGGSESAGSASANGKNPAAGRDTYAGAVQEPAHGGVGGSEASQPLAPVPSPGQQAVTSSTGAVGSGLDSSRTRCPKHPSVVRTPAPNASGSTDPLFAAPVASVTVCAYYTKLAQGLVAPPLTGRRTLVAAGARTLAASLDAASTRFRADLCPFAGVRTFIVYATSTSGGRLSPVLVDASDRCGATVTNGTAVRYAWTVPTALVALTR